MPRKIDTEALSDQAKALQDKFANRIIGQSEATDALTVTLEKFLSGFYDRRRTIANLLFLGPTGTGKTATVEAFAEGLFGDPNKMFKIDCGEFQHSHEIAKLIGSPPGYLGHRETSPLITKEKITQIVTFELPFVILLFDEIEKASDGLWNLLLGIMDKGTLTLGTCEVIDLTKSIILMTSNIGSKEIAMKLGDDSLGFSTGIGATAEELKDTMVSAVRRKFQPEFINRLDNMVMFNTLTRENIEEIYELELTALRKQILANAKVHVLVEPSPAAKSAVLNEGFDKKFGARFLKRTIEKRITLPVARAMASGQLTNADCIVIDVEAGQFKYWIT
jgi:ATP-dependent Clp protease ATP-binding subunit ClpB